ALIAKTSGQKLADEELVVHDQHFHGLLHSCFTAHSSPADLRLREELSQEFLKAAEETLSAGRGPSLKCPSRIGRMTRIFPVLSLTGAWLSPWRAWGAASTSGAAVAPVGSGPRARPSPGSAQLSAGDRQRLWLQFANCLRQHGADEPDPSFDSEGNPQ